MDEQAFQLVERLQHERATYGRIAQIARGAGVTARTLYKLMEESNTNGPSAATIDKLRTYFKREDRRIGK